MICIQHNVHVSIRCPALLWSVSSGTVCMDDPSVSLPLWCPHKRLRFENNSWIHPEAHSHFARYTGFFIHYEHIYMSACFSCIFLVEMVLKNTIHWSTESLCAGQEHYDDERQSRWWTPFLCHCQPCCQSLCHCQLAGQLHIEGNPASIRLCQRQSLLL